MQKCPELMKRYYNLCLGDLSITAKDFDDLHEIRKSLREYFGTWKDKLVSKYVSGDSFNVKYMNKDINWVEILMSFPREKAPEELLGDCKIKARVVPSFPAHTTYDVVCPLEE
jgi:hypothetical protein